MQVLFLDQGDLPFAGLAALESIAFQAFARRDHHVIEYCHRLTTGRADANPFNPAALRKGVE